MIDLKITINVDDTLRALDRLDEDRLRPKIANAVADEDVIPALRKYPTPSRRPQPPRSAAQRRKVFALIKAGEIPYQRTGKTGMSYHKVATSQGVDVTSDLASAAYTRGPGQAPYHKGTWPSHEELADSLSADAALTATGVIVSEIAS